MLSEEMRTMIIIIKVILDRDIAMKSKDSQWIFMFRDHGRMSLIKIINGEARPHHLSMGGRGSIGSLHALGA